MNYQKNSQVAVVFSKRSNGFETKIHKKILSISEKGGIIVEITKRGVHSETPAPRAAVIGVHLDSEKDFKRNIQICKIMQKLLENVGDEAENLECGGLVIRQFKGKTLFDHAIMLRLSTKVKHHYRLGVFWLGKLQEF